MKEPTTKGVRFTAVVEACGQPEVAYLWAPPQQDKSFMSAVRQQRVMTIKQETVGTKGTSVWWDLRRKKTFRISFFRNR